MGKVAKSAGLITSGIFSAGFFTLTLITLVPAEASKLNLLGYYSVCSWAPNSTVMLFFLAIMSLMMALRIKNKSPLKIM